VTRHPETILFTVALLSVCLQAGWCLNPLSIFYVRKIIDRISGVIAFTGITVYTFPKRFPVAPKTFAIDGNDSPAAVPAWAFLVTSSGTVLLCLGTFFCAYGVEGISDETYYEKRGTVSKNDGEIYLVQMGDQRIGDQVFEAFIGNIPQSKTM